MPNISVDIGNGIAGVGVDQLDVHEKGNTFLGLSDVLANEFTGDI